MKNVTELAAKREEYAAAVDVLKQLAETVDAEKRSFTQEEFASYDASEKRMGELAPEIETLERSERVKNLGSQKRSESFGTPSIKIGGSHRQPSPQDYNNAVKAWLLHGTPNSSCRSMDAYKRSAERLEVDWTSQSYECRSQSSDVNSEGGFGTNDSVFKALVQAQAAYGGLEAVCDVQPYDGNQRTHYAVSDDLASTASVGTAQNTLVDNTSLTISRVDTTMTDLKTAVFPISLQSLEDVKFDVLSWVQENLSRRLAKTRANLIAAALADVPTGATSTSTIRETYLRDLYHSVDPYYRNSPNCVWAMNDDTLKALCEQMKNDIGDPLWGGRLSEKPGENILGARTIIVQELESAEIGDPRFPIFFGDFKSVKVDLGTPHLIRDNSRYVDKLAVGMFAYQRMGVKYVASGGNDLKRMSTGTMSGDE